MRENLENKQRCDVNTAVGKSHILHLTSHRSSGITLVALVVTIVVLLILAGITISMVFSDNGIIKSARDASTATKLSELETQANLMYLGSYVGQYTSDGNSTTKADIISSLINQGYDIKQIAAEGSITGIKLDASSKSVGVGETAKITVIYLGDGIQYYALVDGSYYKMNFEESGVTVDRTPSNVDASAGTVTLSANSSNGNVAKVEEIGESEVTISGITIGSATITVSYGDYSETCTIEVGSKPTDTSEAVSDPSTVSFSTSYGTVDVIWLDTGNNVISQPNAPVLTSNGETMTEVTWTESDGTWTEDSTAQTSWYSYTSTSGTSDNNTSRWANAKTANGSYFVWIPRYAYRITYYASQDAWTSGSDPTGYYDGYGMWSAETGEIKYALDTGIKTVTYNGEKYIVHPAFETNLDMGGWDSQLSGFWMAKYEMSGSSGSALTSTYGTASTRSQSIGTQYQKARQATYGYTGSSYSGATGTTVGTYTSYMDSHLTKNSEWGAVAFLTQSQYGRNGHEIDTNNSNSYITGNGGGSTSASAASGITNAYNTATGAKASTTGNVYGVYDMSGGAYEYVASYDKLGNSDYVNGSSYGQYLTQEAKDSEGNYISTKYATAYENSASSSSSSDRYAVCKIGDAIKEVYTGSSGWFSDWSGVAYSSGPFFARGGSSGDISGAGVFCSKISNGYNGHPYGSRCVLCP